MNFVAATMLRNRSIQSDGGEYGSVTLGDDVGTASATSKFLTHEYIVTRLFILKKQIRNGAAAQMEILKTIFKHKKRPDICHLNCQESLIIRVNKSLF